MSKIYALIIGILMVFGVQAQEQEIDYSIQPCSLSATGTVVVSVPGSSIDEAAWGLPQGGPLFMWMWYVDSNGVQADSPTNGEWTNSSTVQQMSYSSSTDVYRFIFTPSTLYGTTDIETIGFLVKAQDGSGDKKSQDILFDLTPFRFTNTTPADGDLLVRNVGETVNINYTACTSVNWTLLENGTQIASNNGTTFSYNHTVAGNSSFQLTAELNGESVTSAFDVIINPTVQNHPIPAGTRDGINYIDGDDTRVRLALYAPGKDYIHVMGSWDDFRVNNTYLMNRDTTDPDMFWLEVSGLTPGEIYTYQYRDSDGITFADPYSHLILSEFDDQFIDPVIYPNLPTFPTNPMAGFEVTVVQTGQTPYPFSAFTPPAKEDLIIYELLVRDFNSEKSYQSLIDDFDYFKNLNINAIELMPVMEFDGHSSWGYNPTHHLALDKAYGPPEKLKEFIELCHQNGIAVILDVAYNHVTQRSGLVRMWSTNTGDNGFGTPAADNPYLNTSTTHAYSFFEDFNHQSEATKRYVKRSLEYWIEEYNIDGFRYDLTKGFTQNCPNDSNGGCTEQYQADRVNVLKEYADYQWSVDDDSYVIFEHLGTPGGTQSEEVEWANYRAGEGKGIMFWGNAEPQFKQNILGFADNSNFDFLDYEVRGFQAPRLVGYPESHDEQRLTYEAINFGNSSGSYDVKDLPTALDRLKAIGALTFMVPGPKMFWQFFELGYDYPINYCAADDGSIEPGCRTDPKPIPEEIGYTTDANRVAVYDMMAKLIDLRLSEDVFKAGNVTIESGDLTPRIYVWDDSIPTTELKNVVVLANLTLTPQNIVPDFPYTGTWYDLINDNTPLNVTNTAATISLQPGEFRIFGNQTVNLSTSDLSVFDKSFGFQISPNPATGGQVNIQLNDAVTNGTVNVYDYNGRLITSYGIKSSERLKTLNTNLKAGIYLVEVTAAEGRSVRKLIVR